jgi:polyferredoxin
MLSAVWLTQDGFWASFNPMQHAFSGRMAGWMILLLVLTLVAALFHYRFWCRYLCPFGAFLALFNKIALLRRLAPTRRFEHCDLGVREEYDIDCIHCNRCLTGTDCRVRK